MRLRNVPFVLVLAGLMANPCVFASQELPSGSLAEQTRDLLVSEAPENPLAVRVDRGRIERLSQTDDDSLYSVPVRLHVPVAGLTLRDEGDEAVSEVRLALAVQDREGRIRSVGEVNVTLRVARELAAGDDAEYVVHLPVQLAAGKYTLALGVADELGSATSFVTGSLKVRRQTSVRELQRPYRLPDRSHGGLRLYQTD